MAEQLNNSFIKRVVCGIIANTVAMSILEYLWHDEYDDIILEYNDAEMGTD